MKIFRQSLKLLTLLAAGHIAARISVRASVQTTVQDSEARRKLLYRITDEMLTPGKFDLLDECVAAEYVVHCPLGDLDRNALKGLFGAFRTSFSDFKVARDHVLIDGDYASTRSSISGVFNTEFPMGGGMIPPNGKSIKFEVINIFKFDGNGMIVEEWAQFDNYGFMVQLGAISAPPSG